jgi:hypothetical protein
MDFNTLLTAMFTNGIGAACAAAVLYFGWWRETRTIPQMLETFGKAHANGLAAFTRSQDSLQTSFQARNDKALEVFSLLVREERAIYQKWHDENRGRLDKIMDELKEQRHYTRDLAHQMGLRQAVEEEQYRVGHLSDPDVPGSKS